MSKLARSGKQAVSNTTAHAMNPRRGMHGLSVRIRARVSKNLNPGSRILLTLAAWSAWCSPVVAVERGITVSGTGVVMARPTQVEIDVSVSAAAELTADAIQKYRDSLRRTTEAFKKLEMKDLIIEERELSFAHSTPGDDDEDGIVNFNVFGGGNVPAGAKPQVHISRALRLVLGGIDQLDEPTLMETIGTLLDTARDASATVGRSSSNALMAQMMGQQSDSSSMVTYVINDAAEQHEKAYQEAFAEAKARATRLASLAGKTLGEVIAIQEATDAGMVSEIALMTAIYDSSGDKSNRGLRLTAEKLGNIPVHVTLHVRFLLGSQEDQPSSGEEEDSK
jgi:uncharacterized protein